MNDDFSKAVSDIIEQNVNRRDFDFDDSWPGEQKIKAINESDIQFVKEEQLVNIIKRDASPDVRMSALKKLGKLGGEPLTWIKIAVNDSDAEIRKYALEKGLAQNITVRKNALALLVNYGMNESAARQKVNAELGHIERDIEGLIQKSPYQDVRDAYSAKNPGASKPDSSYKSANELTSESSDKPPNAPPSKSNKIYAMIFAVIFSAAFVIMFFMQLFPSDAMRSGFKSETGREWSFFASLFYLDWGIALIIVCLLAVLSWAVTIVLFKKQNANKN